jgi:hypothetical protein
MLKSYTVTFYNGVDGSLFEEMEFSETAIDLADIITIAAQNGREAIVTLSGNKHGPLYVASRLPRFRAVNDVCRYRDELKAAIAKL